MCTYYKPFVPTADVWEGAYVAYCKIPHRRTARTHTTQAWYMTAWQKESLQFCFFQPSVWRSVSHAGANFTRTGDVTMTTVKWFPSPYLCISRLAGIACESCQNVNLNEDRTRRPCCFPCVPYWSSINMHHTHWHEHPCTRMHTHARALSSVSRSV